MRLTEQLGELPELGAMRLTGLQRYLAAPLPDRVAHLWRYTEPTRLLPPGPIIPAAFDQQIRRAPRSSEAAAIVLTAGKAPRICVSDEASRAGLVVKPLSDPKADPHRLTTAVTPDHGLFEALNTAAWSSGVVVRVPRRCTLAEPIRIVVPANQPTNLPRILIQLEEGADATVVEEHLGGSAESMVIAVSELFAGPGSRLRYVLLEDWAPGVGGHLTARVCVERDAEALTVLHSFGGAQLKLDLGGVLLAPGARSELVGFTLGSDHQHFDQHTEHHHQAERTWSNIDMKVALADRARSAYTGLIRIDDSAHESEAYQEQRNLLLSERCRADSIPELEIETNEVHCSHGSTSSPVDAEHLFYLHSRGIPPAEATRMVVRGFFEGALQRLPVGLRATVEGRIEQRLDRIGFATRAAEMSREETP